MKFRELVRYGDQAGIPENLRSMEKTESKLDREARRAMVLRFIREHSGKKFQLNQVATMVGYASGASVYKILSDLEYEGLVKKMSIAHGTPRYEYIGIPDLPKGDSRNGEVTVTKLPELPEIEPVEEPMPEQPEFPDYVKEPLGDDFVASLDALTWRYIRSVIQPYNNDELARLVKTLIKFGDYVRTEMDGKDETKEETAKL